MTNLVTLFEDSDLSGLPAANPGNGKPWIDPTSHAVIVGALGTFGVSQAYVDTGLSNKADLVAGKVPASQLPSYVDDVLEFANLAAFPGTGETGKIYVALNTNRTYRWSGSAYVELTDSTAVWGAISGTLSNQTDLQNALNSKANSATTLAGYGITNALAQSGGTLTGALGVNGASVGTGSFAVAGPTGRRVDYDVNGNLVVTAPEGTAGTVRVGSAYTRKGVYSDTDLTLTSEAAFAFWVGNSVRALQMDSTTADLGSLTGAVTLPSGTTAQRPSSPTAGMMRYNSTDGRHEFRTASSWVNHARLTGDNFTGPITTTGDVSAVSLNLLCQGRLTTESGVAISTSDRTAQSIIYFTPFNGNRIALYNGTRWQTYTLTERNLTLSGLTSGRLYDVFVYDNAGTLTLELSAAWNSDNVTRSDALTRQDGVWVKGSDATRRYLGTIYTTGTSTTEASNANRYVWNFYNQVERPLYRYSGATHTYNSTTQREWNGDQSARVNFIQGFASFGFFAVHVRVSISNVGGWFFASLNSLTDQAYNGNAGATAILPSEGARQTIQGLNYLTCTEFSSGSMQLVQCTTFGSILA